MAAEIRTFVRTVGPALFPNYRTLRMHIRRLELSETAEALEFARRYFTSPSIREHSKVDSIPGIDIDELARSIQGAVLCPRRRCFSAEICEPSNFTQFRELFDSSRLAGMGKRLAVAFMQVTIWSLYTCLQSCH